MRAALSRALHAPLGADRRLLERLWPFFRPYRLPFLIGSLFGVGDSGCQTLILLALKPAIHAASLGDLARLGWVLAGMFGLVLVKSVFNFAQEFLVFSAGLRTTMDLRNRAYAHLQSLSLGFFHRTRTGQIMSRLTNDARVIEEGLTSNLTNAVTAPCTVLFGVLALVKLDWRLSLLSVFLVPAVVALVQRGSRYMRRAAHQRQERQADLTTVLEETISGVRVVQSFGGESREVERFRRVALETFRASMRGVRVTAILTPTLEIVSILAVILVIGLGSIEMRAGRIGVDGLLVFVMLLNSVATAFKQLGRTHTSFQQTFSAADRLCALLDETPEVHDLPDARPLPHCLGAIGFDDVRFAYDAENPVLEGIRLAVRPGERVAFVGSSGAGKTTLVNLVPRFYDPQSGRVTVDGLDVRHLRLEDLRKQIGIVPQETLLFSGTIAENIAYGRDGETLDAIRAAARTANADGFIAGLPQGYDTVVGERGAKLSGGQRQRIAIARAVLKDPAILILDEATSSLDPESEQSVAEALERLMQGRTTLVIAHRLATIRRADRIFVIDGGRIVEEGSDDQLLARDGVYRRLFHSQGVEAFDAA